MDLFDKIAPLPSQHEQIAAMGRDPFGVCMDEVRSATEAIIHGKKVILAGSNNYLGLTFDPESISAAQNALARQGTGTTGSRIANGTYANHRELESELASFFGCKSTLVFPTGYQANLGMISALAGPGDYILMDAHCHACIYDGCRMSGATVIRFRHNSPADLDKRLQRLKKSDSNKLIIVEGLYSMLGDIAPLAEFAEVKRKHNAYLYVDEAHSVGIYGQSGQGVVEQAGVSADVDFIVGTFSKSLGSMGGFCASNHPKFDYLRLASRPYMFTASLSPSVVASVLTSLRRIRREPELRDSLWRNVHAFYDRLAAIDLTLAAAPSPVIAVMLPHRDEAVLAWNRILDAGVYVNLAIPPGTPDTSSLLRCSVSAAHSPDQIETICGAFEYVAESTRLYNARGRNARTAGHVGE